MKDSKKTKKSRWNPIDWLLGLFVPEVEVTRQVAEDAKDVVRFQRNVAKTSKGNTTVTVDPNTGVTTTTTTMQSCESSSTTIGTADPQPSCLDIQAKDFVDPADGKLKSEIRIVRLVTTYSAGMGIPVDAEGYAHLEYDPIVFVAANDQEIDAYLNSLLTL